jgi:hypothetical protein
VAIIVISINCDTGARRAIYVMNSGIFNTCDGGFDRQNRLIARLYAKAQKADFVKTAHTFLKDTAKAPSYTIFCALFHAPQI